MDPNVPQQCPTINGPGSQTNRPVTAGEPGSGISPQTNRPAVSAHPRWGGTYLTKAPTVSSLSRGSKSGSSNSTSLWADFKPWIKDVLSCLLACLALMAIVITLATHNGRTLPNWKFGITVNALVSIFAVIWKAAMVAPVANAISQLKWSWFRQPRPLIDLARFDEASRGVLGSVWLIGRLRGVHLAWVGALISVFAIASDPFIQQVVKYSSCPRVVLNVTALVPRTNVYSAALPQAGADEPILALPMQAAVFEGLYNIFPQIQPVCATGNCTFPNFSTIGMCGGCEDISHDLETKCHTGEGPNAQECQWTLPSNLTLESLGNPYKSMVMRAIDMTGNFLEVAAKDVVSQTQIITVTDVLDYDNAGSYNLTEGSGSVQQSAMALQCSLWPCVRTYSAEVHNGVFSETPVSNFNMTYNSSVGTGSFDAAPLPCLINGTYYNASNFAEKNSTYHDQMPWQASDNESLFLPSQCIYRYYNPMGLVDHLVDVLNGRVAFPGFLAYAKPSWMGKLFNNDSATIDSVNETWANLADSITTQMRQTATPGYKANIAGETWQTDTCIAAQWEWLAYPLVLLLMTIVLLTITIVKSHRDTGIQIWKSSPLPLLFHGLEVNLLEGAEDAGDLSEMQDLSKRMTVSLGQDGARLALIGNFSDNDE